MLRPGERLVTLFPSFPLHEDYATVMGAVVERVGVRDDLTIDVDAGRRRKMITSSKRWR